MRNALAILIIGVAAIALLAWLLPYCHPGNPALWVPGVRMAGCR